MFTVPRKITIGSSWVDIRLHVDMSNWTCAGWASPDDHLILVDNRLNADQRFDTLIHEILHVIRMEYCMNVEDDDKEDRRVQRQTNGLLQFLTSLGMSAEDLDWSSIPIVESVDIEGPFPAPIRIVEQTI